MSTQTQSDLATFFSRCRSLVDQELDRLLPSEHEMPFRVHQAIRWSVFAGGKRFRPVLVFATGETFGSDFKLLLRTAAAFEMIHSYSLIHDDLPSMDDDDLRRGRPTCHVRFDEATAILAGDALQTLAFGTIANDEQLSHEIRIRLIGELASAAGTPTGMVAGQAEDLQAESRAVTPEDLETIHRQKTGALIVAAARAGAIVARANDQELASIGIYADRLGLLFQITDDLLDVSATAEALGKTPGKDARSEKATYPGVHGVEAARNRAIAVHHDACAALEPLQQSTDRLCAIADFILFRKK